MLLCSLCQIPVDPPGFGGPARHRRDQDRGLEGPAEELEGAVDLRQVDLRKGRVDELEGGQSRVLSGLDVLLQVDPDVVGFALRGVRN
jgi:hypothetical protein